MYEYILMAVISAATTYVVGKLLLKDTKTDLKQQITESLPSITPVFVETLTKTTEKLAPSMIDYMINEFEAYITSPEGAKTVYSIGGLIGNGAKQGLGLNPKRGKFKMDDLISGVIGGYIQQYLPMPNTQQGNTNKVVTTALGIE